MITLKLARVIAVLWASFSVFSFTKNVFPQIPESSDLFTEVILENIELSDEQEKILNTLKQNKVTIDLRVVKVNVSSLRREHAINLNLFPGKNFAAFGEKIEKRNDTNFDWFGSISERSGNIILSIFDDTLVGFVIVDGESYNIWPLGHELHAIVQVDPTKYARCGNSSGQQDVQNRMGLQQNGKQLLLQNNLPKSILSNMKKQQTVSVVKVIVAYTAAAKNGAGGTNAINNIVNNAIAAANQSYVNSGNVPMQLELVHAYEVSYIESNASEPSFFDECGYEIFRRTALARFQDPTDGYMDEIHELRGFYGGDVAVLITDPIVGDCGQAFTIEAAHNEVFSYVAYNCANAVNKWSLAHEIGHLQGARHDLDNCNIPYSYGHGYTPSGQTWTTMMGVKEGNTRIQYWSNPNVLYQGVPTGTTTTNNNARVLEETASTVAEFVKEISGTISGTLSGIYLFTGNTTASSNLTIASSAQIFFKGNVILTINNGVTLTINPGAKLKFGSGATVVVNGGLQAIGTSVNKIIFDRVFGATGKWGGIRIENSTAGSSLEYCTIRNGTYGVRLNNTSGNVNVNHATLTNNTTAFQALYSSPFTIQNSTMQNNSYGIYVRSSAASGDMKILSNNLSANIIRSIYLYDGADAFLGANTITNDIEGITCTTNSDPTIRRSSGNYGYNTIRNNSGPGVKAVANSYPSLGINDPAQTKYGYNEIHSNGGYEVENGNSSGAIMAERNYWSSDHNVPANPSDTYGSVDYLPVLPEGPPPPAPPGSGSRVLAKSSITFDEAFDLEIRDEYQAAADLYYKLRPMILTPTM